MIAAHRADVQPKAWAGRGGNHSEGVPGAAQRDSAGAGGSGGQRMWLALSLDDQPSLYQSGRWELFMTMAQPGCVKGVGSLFLRVAGWYVSLEVCAN